MHSNLLGGKLGCIIISLVTSKFKRGLEVPEQHNTVLGSTRDRAIADVSQHHLLYGSLVVAMDCEHSEIVEQLRCGADL